MPTLCLLRNMHHLILGFYSLMMSTNIFINKKLYHLFLVLSKYKSIKSIVMIVCAVNSKKKLYA